MPKAAVDENSKTMLGENEVRSSDDGPVEAIAQPPSPTLFPKKDFWRRVFCPNPAHTQPSLLEREHVGANGIYSGALSI